VKQNMKKILLSITTVALVATAAVGATRAYFSDTETSVGNRTLDLKVDDKDGANVVTITKTNMKPQAPYTYQGYNNQFVLKNAGSLPGTVTWVIKNVNNFENGCNDPETKLLDTTCGTGNDQGELGQYTWIKWSRNGPTYEGYGTKFDPLNSANGVTVTGPVLNPGDTFNAYMWLDFPRRTDDMENLAQGDSLQFDVEFKLEQIP